MKYAFIINPASGRKMHKKRLIHAIEVLAAEHPEEDIRIFYTKSPEDAEILADLIPAETDEDTVVFACGGDGTVQDVVNGLIGHENAILGVVPYGSGNDLARALAKGRGNAADYRVPSRQLGGETFRMDLIKMTWTDGSAEKCRYIVNGVNIGFDGNTAILSNELKKMPGISGTASYMLAVIKNLAAKKGQRLRITADGKAFHTGDLLLATAANGGFCGGGVESCPNAELTDGLIELMAIKDVTRRRFAALFPAYKEGRIFQKKGIENIINYSQVKSVTIEPMLGDEMGFVGDGEEFHTAAVHLEIVPEAIRVLRP